MGNIFFANDRVQNPIMSQRGAALRIDQLHDLPARAHYFHLPEDIIYLNGNSLGPITFRARERVSEHLSNEWHLELIKGWNSCDWVTLPETVGRKIAGIIGADLNQVRCCDSTSVNLFKLLTALLQHRSDRSVVVSDRNNFPTDLYIAQGVIQQLGNRHRLQLADSPDEIESMLHEDVAVLMLSHVNYQDGALYDIQALTEAAHRKGILTLWDLAHSAGALPVKVTEYGVDGAVGCGYKFLNGGPGAPAFLYLDQQLSGQLDNPLSGWFSHVHPFQFSPEFIPAESMDRFLTGTPPVMAMIALDAALDAYDGVDINQLRQQSLVLSDFVIERTAPLADKYWSDVDNAA